MIDIDKVAHFTDALQKNDRLYCLCEANFQRYLKCKRLMFIFQQHNNFVQLIIVTILFTVLIFS